MNAEEIVEAIKEDIEDWASKQGEYSCWYYPEIFLKIALRVGAEVDYPLFLPPRTEFEKGCKKWQDEKYGVEE